MFKKIILEKMQILLAVLKKYWLLIFFIATIDYLELVYRLCDLKGMRFDFVFPLLFSLSAGTVLFLIASVFKSRVNRLLVHLITLLLIIVYGVQLVYYSIFHVPLAVYSLSGTDNALEFKDIIISAIFKNIIPVVLLLVPFSVLFVLRKKFSFPKIKRFSLFVMLLFCVLGYVASVMCVNLTGKSAVSQYSLYYNISSPELSVNKLGLMTTMRLDFQRLVFGFEQKDEETFNTENPDDLRSSVTNGSSITKDSKDISKTGLTTPTSVSSPTEEYNIMNINFKTLIANEKDKNLLNMHKYFASVKPTKKNKYTGMFKGDNLIFITAESLSPYAISPELTPTLYNMLKTGFVFNNFYNPIWGVSTTDGEYVACTGLIPKSGTWSFADSAKNYLPFVMGNQFKKLGCPTRAYHNHSYKYYKRNLSHPNMGYDYKGFGNGLEVKKTWPESDLQMINLTAGDYIGPKLFHTYYMTVSGHMNYTYYGNYIADKNKKLVAGLPYSEPARAYVACNLEFEFAMKALIEKLEAAGIVGNTVIAISPDHYPYGLPKENLDELAGHEVETNFEMYKSTLILWKKGMDPVIIDEPCSSLDIIPTLSNLLGLEFDSSLLMGSDILSDASPLVIFSNRSWITDRAKYNSVTNDITFTDGTQKDDDYVDNTNKTVFDKFKFSAKILETDYYRKIIPNAPKKQ